jgi:hypothetical protein
VILDDPGADDDAADDLDFDYTYDFDRAEDKLFES